MRKFLLHISIFAVATCGLYTIMAVVNKNLGDSEIQRDFSGIETLILGDSRAHWINEKVIDNSLNLFQGGDTYKASYYKLLKIHQFNPNIANVVIAFDAHNLNGLYEKRISEEKESIRRIHQLSSISEMINSTSNYQALVELISRYVFTLNFNQLFDHKRKYKFDDHSEYKTKENSIAQHEKRSNTKKDYSYLKSTDSIATKKRIKGAEWFYFRQHLDNQGTLSLKYLKQILAYNEAKNITTTLVSMPIDPDLLEKIDKKNIRNFDVAIRDLSQNFKFQYLNLRHEFDSRINLLENPDHVSEYGGVLVSQIIMDEISKR